LRGLDDSEMESVSHRVISSIMYRHLVLDR
jgi:hypothetical protein